MAVTFFSDPIDITPSSFTADTWTDLDVTSHVPVGTTGVFVHVYNSNAVDRRFGIRKNGSTDTLNSANGGDIESLSHMWLGIGVDGSDIFEYICEVTDGSMELYLVAATGSDWTWQTNSTDYTPGTATTWTDADISGDTSGGALVAVFHAGANNDTGRVRVGARKNGSTDAREQTVEAWCHMVVGLDASEIAEVYVSTLSSEIALLGWGTGSVTMHTNATDVTPGSASTWTNFAALPAGAIGGIYEIQSGNATNTYGLREEGAETGAVVDRPNKNKAWSVVKADGSRIVEGQTSTTTGLLIYEVGYFEEAAVEGGAIMTTNKGMW